MSTKSDRNLPLGVTPEANEKCALSASFFRSKPVMLASQNPGPPAGSVSMEDYMFLNRGSIQLLGSPSKFESVAPSANKRQEGGTHYRDMDIEPWDVIDTWPVEQRIGFYRGNALKYTMRMGSKDEQLQEAKKARHYLDKLIEVLSE